MDVVNWKPPDSSITELHDALRALLRYHKAELFAREAEQIIGRADEVEVARRRTIANELRAALPDWLREELDE
jgi:hypothetical protein